MFLGGSPFGVRHFQTDLVGRLLVSGYYLGVVALFLQRRFCAFLQVSNILWGLFILNNHYVRGCLPSSIMVLTNIIPRFIRYAVPLYQSHILISDKSGWHRGSWPTSGNQRSPFNSRLYDINGGHRHTVRRVFKILNVFWLRFHQFYFKYWLLLLILCKSRLCWLIVWVKHSEIRKLWLRSAFFLQRWGFQRNPSPGDSEILSILRWLISVLWNSKRDQIW